MKLLSDISCGGGNDDECQKKKHSLALRLHEYETKTLSSRCMLLAGYGHHIAKEGTPTQLRFALEAWQNEGKRLQELLRINSDSTLDDAPLFVAEQQSTQKKNDNSEIVASPHAHSGGHACLLKDGHHVHRLEGKCGHRAILHQPEGGRAHIDFVVGDKIECYGDTQPLQSGLGRASASGGALWPSQYKCDEVKCDNAKECADAAGAEKHEHSPECRNTSKAKILDLNNVDLTSKEWTSDVNDDVLMSLFRLGNKNSSDMSVISELPEF